MEREKKIDRLVRLTSHILSTAVQCPIDDENYDTDHNAETNKILINRAVSLAIMTLDCIEMKMERRDNGR